MRRSNPPPPSSNDFRPDGTRKGKGWLGYLSIRMPDGSTGVATEYSTQSQAVRVNGRQIDFPTLVPTLTPQEVRMMVENIIPYNKPPPESVMRRAIDHALARIAANRSPFAENSEPRSTAFRRRPNPLPPPSPPPSRPRKRGK